MSYKDESYSDYKSRRIAMVRKIPIDKMTNEESLVLDLSETNNLLRDRLSKAIEWQEFDVENPPPFDPGDEILIRNKYKAVYLVYYSNGIFRSAASDHTPAHVTHYALITDTTED